MADALCSSEQRADVADELKVTVELQARLDHLHPSERGYLKRRLSTKEQTA